MDGMDGAVAEMETPLADTGDTNAEVNNEAGEAKVETGKENTQDKSGADKGKVTDPLQARIAELRKNADSIADPKLKEQYLNDIKALRDTTGKAKAYETVFPTVREARDIKTLVESVGGSEGLQKIQTELADVKQTDSLLNAGDPSIIPELWKAAPEGMAKLAPVIFDQLAKENPQAYESAMAPHFVSYLDRAQFPEAFDTMTQFIAAGKKDEALQIAARMAKWVGGLRSQSESKSTEPVKSSREQELEKQLNERSKTDHDRTVNEVYGDVSNHAGGVIDKYLKPIVANLSLSKDQYDLLRKDVWKHIQDTRNSDKTYKTVASNKWKSNPKDAAAYMKQWTDENAETSARSIAKLRYGHQMKNGAAPDKKVNPTSPNRGAVQGEMPSADQIDYDSKGQAIAKKQGYKDVQAMVFDGRAPLKNGEIRVWRPSSKK